MMRILLLNPPGKKYYMRDYYCSKISKALYYNQPVDFIILSGVLSQEFNVDVVDCIAEKLNESASLERILEIKPDVIIFLTGVVSMSEDFIFLRKVKTFAGSLMVGSGDIFIEHAVDLLKTNDFIDAALLDFTTQDIVKFLKDRTSDFNNIIYRDKKGVVKRQEKHDRKLRALLPPYKQNQRI